MNDLYIFIDESGNLDFSPKGTKYFVFSAITCFSPEKTSAQVEALKYHFMRESSGGLKFSHFHATEDKQHVRIECFL